MSEYKYPYIPREYYAAVMFACKMIRETGNFNKSVKVSARYYDVDEDTLIEHIRKRQGAGQRFKGSSRRRKYKYFLVGAIYETCEGSQSRMAEITIERGLTAESVEKKFIDSDWKYDARNDTGSYYSSIRYHKVLEEFETKEEAIERAKEYAK